MSEYRQHSRSCICSIVTYLYVCITGLLSVSLFLCIALSVTQYRSEKVRKARKWVEVPDALMKLQKENREPHVTFVSYEYMQNKGTCPLPATIKKKKKQQIIDNNILLVWSLYLKVKTKQNKMKKKVEGSS